MHDSIIYSRKYLGSHTNSVRRQMHQQRFWLHAPFKLVSTSSNPGEGEVGIQAVSLSPLIPFLFCLILMSHVTSGNVQLYQPQAGLTCWPGCQHDWVVLQSQGSRTYLVHNAGRKTPGLISFNFDPFDVSVAPRDETRFPLWIFCRRTFGSVWTWQFLNEWTNYLSWCAKEISKNYCHLPFRGESMGKATACSAWVWVWSWEVIFLLP